MLSNFFALKCQLRNLNALLIVIVNIFYGTILHTASETANLRATLHIQRDHKVTLLLFYLTLRFLRLPALNFPH